MRNLKKLLSIALILVLASTMAFAGGEQEGAEAQKTAKLVYVNWEEGVAYTHLAKVVLEDQMGYEVEITAADVAPAYASVAQGDMDAYMESWLPVLHKNYIENFGDDLTDLGYVYEGTQSGLVVPGYMDITTISEINDIADELGGKITGIDAGAGVMQTTEEVIEMYGLDVELMASSGPAMAAALKDAYEKQRPIVVTGWRPHTMFGRWDLRFLEQDKDQVWGVGNIHIFGRKNIHEDKPELAQFLENFYFTDAQLADLMLTVAEGSDAEAAAREWMNDNMDVVEKWLP
ncbi:MAG TPA: glycine betaine ABC transporter substrate-binding protein [Sediminispirochaeta sp.]|nr:glycine betaine ABC transporter substrate-binding protein [Sediminispirochaeta sp.]